MARVNVYLPDELYARAMEADVNLSGTLRGALVELLAAADACTHDGSVICAKCRRPIGQEAHAHP